MKHILVLSLFLSSSVFAQNSADISCSDDVKENSFQINTKTGEVLYNNSVKVGGPVFSGINSSKNFVGEILAEIKLNETDYYITLIMRNVSGKAQMEARWYPKKNSSVSINMRLNNCELN